MSAGYLPPRYEEIRASVVAKWKLKYGDNADTSSDDVDGLFIDILALMNQTGYDGLAEVSSQHFLGSATGLNIDAVLYPYFNIKRNPATRSTSEVLLYGTPATVIDQLSRISTVDTASEFEITDDVTIVSGTQAIFVFDAIPVSTTIDILIGAALTSIPTEGTAAEVAADVASSMFLNANIVTAQYVGLQPDGRAIVHMVMTAAWTISTTEGDAWNATIGFARAVETGPISAAFGTLTRVAESVAGWEGVVNVIDATVGVRAETDSAYKARHKLAIRAIGKCTPRAVSQILKALEGVTAVKLYQNTAGYEVAGRPSHSWEFVVDGGDQDLIAEAIWLGHTFGTQSWGTTTVEVIDDQGLVEQPRFMKFSRPNYRYIHVQIYLYRGEGFPLLPLTDIPGMIGAALETWGNTLGIGRDVYRYEIGVEIGKTLPGIRTLEISLASTSTPLGSPIYAATDLTMGDLDYSRWAASRVTVVVV